MKNNNISIFLLLAVIPFALAGCVGGNQAPDELSVIEGPPLWLPPDYELRPPREAGSDNLRRGPQSMSADLPEQTTVTEDWLLQQAGADRRNTNIREELTIEKQAAAETKEEESFLSRLNPFDGNDDE